MNAGAARQAEVLAAGFWASGEEIIAAVARGSKERPRSAFLFSKFEDLCFVHTEKATRISSDFC